MKCSVCGHPVQQGVGFCVGCGLMLNRESDSTPTAEQRPLGHGPDDPPREAPVKDDGLDEGPAGYEGTSTVLKVRSGTRELRSLKTMLASVGVVIVAGLGFMALSGGDAETVASGSSESSDSDASLEDNMLSSPAGTGSAEASASPRPTASTVIPLPDFDSSSEVRDSVLIYDSYSGLEVQVAGDTDVTSFPSPVGASGLEVTNQIQDVTGSGAEPLLAVLVETRKPASGLEPESYSTVLRTYERDSSGPTLEAAVPSIKHTSFGSLSIYGSNDGSITLADSSYSDPAVRFFAADTLNETGTVAASYIGQRGGTVFVSPTDNDCAVSAWSPASGVQMWTRDYGLSVDYSSCRVDVTAEGIVVEVNGGSDYLSVIDPLTGNSNGPHFPEATAVRFDSGAPLVAVEYMGSEPSETALRVYDTETWQPRLDVTRERFNALGMHEYYLYGGKLYMTNTDEQPVLDAASGEKLSENWSLRPIKPVGTGWTLVKDDDDNSYSLRANKDGVYDGPWW